MSTISIIVVCLNGPPGNIHDTLVSIINQDYSQTDLVVVDGGSRVETIEALNRYLPWIGRFISEADDGIYDAMNKGVELASGQWVIFMNIGDKFHTKDTLSALMREAEQDSNADMVFGKPAMNNKLKDSYLFHFPPRMRKWYFYRGYICHQTILTKKSVFQKIGGFDKKYKLVGDRDWLLRFVRNGLKSKSVDLTVCDYDHQGASSDFEKVDRERKQMVTSHFPLWERCFCELIWTVVRISIRIKTGNFSLPFALRRL